MDKLILVSVLLFAEIEIILANFWVTITIIKRILHKAPGTIPGID